ncbi:hypothetical protein VTJ49DRAFT_2383 [Mycothermus thermophilus]|uniref:Uncharacterized protein n=1 Tax=Humicola insolens TaxID=85995 RepID=A0ABR3VNY1_HUMIN
MATAETTAPPPDHGAVQPSTANDEVRSQVQDVLSSDEFAQFLKKRSILEDEHANSLKKLCRSSSENMQRPEHRGGTFGRAYEEMMLVHERMADNGLQFAMSLHQMAEDLAELVAIADKSRKGWKQSGLAAEQRVAELEAAMRKSKAKYDGLAEEYDRARTGDTTGRQGGKMFGFKGHKTGAAHEEDLLRKAQVADQDYQGKVQAASAERSELETKTRPETVQALQDIVRECDSGLALQMQKFASFNEKLVLSNGLSLSPLKQTPEARSLRETVLSIDNEKDLNDYLCGQYVRLPPRTGPPKYERNHLLEPSNRAPGATQQSQQPTPGLAQQQPPPPTMFSSNSRSNTFTEPVSSPQHQPPMGHSYNQSMGSLPLLGGPPRPPSQPQHERSYSHGSAANQTGSASQPFRGPSPQQGHQSQPSASRFTPASSQGPPQLGALPFQAASSQPSQPASYAPLPSQPSAGPATTPANRQSPPAAPQLASPRPVFGVSLQKLYERDGLAVPMVVYQCIQAVDLFGLNVEGIYRLSGSLPHVNKLKNLFDTDSSSGNLDFRNPENFFHDVNSVAGLLKQFFRDLPDPLMTRENYAAFIEAAKNEDNIVRRDSLHAIINNLPDPNYATLRALTLHLHRVIENSSSNRMSSQNLAIVFGPTLMGTAPGSNISDAGWQVRVVDTILQNTYQIFDDDD